MLFLNPFLLWGLCLIAVPIIIYLIFQRKIKQVQWAAMQFLIDIIEERKRKMQIEDLLLLLLRVLVIAALAGAAARPFLDGGLGSMFAGSRAVIVLDGSYSMRTTSGVTTRWQKAQEEAIKLVEGMDSGTDITLVIGSELPESRIGEFTNDHDLVIETIRSLTPSDLAGAPAATIEFANSLLQEFPGDATTIHILSDFQERDWLSAVERLKASLEGLPDNVAVNMIPIVDDQTRNVAVSDVRVVGGSARVGLESRVIANVRMYGDELPEAVAVELLVDGESIDQRSVTAVPNQDAELGFTWIADRPGWQQITIRIDGDAVNADNERHLAVPVVDAVQVLCVSQDAVDKRRATDFMALALDPRAIGQESDESLFQFTRRLPDDFITEQLDDYDLVVWAHVNEPTLADAAHLQEYIKGGGGALLFLGPDTDPLAYNAAFGSQDEAPGLFPVPLREEALGADLLDDPLLFVGATPGHPIWQSVLGEGIDYLSAVDVFAAWPFVQDLGGDGVTLATVASNEDDAQALPVIADLRFGRGHAVVVGTSADLGWTNFPLRPAFIPFINQAVPYLRSFEGGAGNVIVGEPVRRYVPFERSQATYQIDGPDGSIATASVLEGDDGYVLEIPTPRQSGAYRLRNVDDANDWNLVTANVRLNEGEIGVVSPSALDERYGSERVAVSGTSTSEGPRAGGAQFAGILLLLMLLFWLGENLLAHKIAKQV